MRAPWVRSPPCPPDVQPKGFAYQPKKADAYQTTNGRRSRAEWLITAYGKFNLRWRKIDAFYEDESDEPDSYNA